MTNNQHLPGNPFEANAQDDPRNMGGTTANALLAVAYEQRQTNTLLRTYLDSVNPPAAHDEQLQQDITDEQITSLAATLWQADPGNQASPAQRFQDDYAHRQDQYLAMARAALGITDQPTQKDSRRP